MVASQSLPSGERNQRNRYACLRLRFLTFSSLILPFFFFFLSAHDEAVCALHFNPRIPNCFVTGSYDKTVKVWDIKDNKPTCVVSRDLGIVSALFFLPPLSLLNVVLFFFGLFPGKDLCGLVLP